MTKTCSGYDTVVRDGHERSVFVSIEWLRVQNTPFSDAHWEPVSVDAETCQPDIPGPVELTRSEQIEFEAKYRPCS